MLTNTFCLSAVLRIHSGFDMSYFNYVVMIFVANTASTKHVIFQNEFFIDNFNLKCKLPFILDGTWSFWRAV